MTHQAGITNSGKNSVRLSIRSKRPGSRGRVFLENIRMSLTINKRTHDHAENQSYRNRSIHLLPDRHNNDCLYGREQMLNAIKRLFWCSIVFALPAYAGEPVSSQPKATLNDAKWLCGYWVGTGFGGDIEEIWSLPSAGTLMGSFRLMEDDEVIFYEIETIEAVADSLVLKVKHFNPDLTGWEEADEVVTFPLTEIAPGRLVFGGVSYDQVDAENLTVSVIISRKDGSKYTEIIAFHRRVSW